MFPTSASFPAKAVSEKVGPGFGFPRKVLRVCVGMKSGGGKGADVSVSPSIAIVAALRVEGQALTSRPLLIQNRLSVLVRTKTVGVEVRAAAAIHESRFCHEQRVILCSPRSGPGTSHPPRPPPLVAPQLQHIPDETFLRDSYVCLCEKASPRSSSHHLVLFPFPLALVPSLGGKCFFDTACVGVSATQRGGGGREGSEGEDVQPREGATEGVGGDAEKVTGDAGGDGWGRRQRGRGTATVSVPSSDETCLNKE